MWTAEIQILNEDMIVAVVIAIQTIANKPAKKYLCKHLKANFRGPRTGRGREGLQYQDIAW